MSLNKIIAIFGVILVLFIAFIFYQFSTKSTPAGKTAGSSKVTINGTTFTVEVAKTPEQQQAGLSNRKSLAQNSGMLFIFNKPDYYNFWMKDMKFPLDMLFINGTTVMTVYENVPPPANAAENENPPVIAPSGPIDKVLEINAGMVKKYGIKAGDTVEITL